MSKQSLKSAAVPECLSFSEFIGLLAKVHKNGLQAQLDVHFRPQHLVCFREHSPDEYDIVTSLATNHSLLLLRRIAQYMHLEPVALEVKHQSVLTNSPDSKPIVTASDQQLLKEVTAEEYRVFGKYLEHTSAHG